MTTTTFFVGPLRVEIETALPLFERRIEEQLCVFERRWEDPSFVERLVVRTTPDAGARASGSFLQCSRMNVDRIGGELFATTLCGASARSERTGSRVETWTIEFPEEYVRTPALDELEDLVGLALVSGWRASGWMPVHGGAVASGGRCAILCAMSGGGKSTLTAALVRDGWRTLGDDKLLLRANADGTTELAALLHTFNLHPRTREWFPEVGDLERLPMYSAWTVKRKVRADDVWPGRTAERARPTHVLRVRREERPGAMRLVRMPDDEVFRTLIGQIAIPNDRTIAAAAMQAVAAAVRSGLRGFDVVVGEGAYGDPRCLRPLYEALA